MKKMSLAVLAGCFAAGGFQEGGSTSYNFTMYHDGQVLQMNSDDIPSGFTAHESEIVQYKIGLSSVHPFPQGWISRTATPGL